MIKTARNTVLTGRIISILLLSLLAPICTMQAQTFTFKSKKSGKEASMPIDAAYFSDTIISLYQDSDITMPETLDTERLTKVLNDLDEVPVDEEVNQQDDVPVEKPVNDLCLIINFLRELHSTYKELVPTLSFPKDLDKREVYAPKVIKAMTRVIRQAYKGYSDSLTIESLELLINDARYLGLPELIHASIVLLVEQNIINEDNYKDKLWKEKFMDEEMIIVHGTVGRKLTRKNPDAFYPVELTAIQGTGFDKRIKKQYGLETTFLTFHPNNKELMFSIPTIVRGLLDEELQGSLIRIGNVALTTAPRTLFQDNHTGDIINGIIHPSGKVAATSAHDITVKIWNLETGGNIATIIANQAELQYSPDGSKLAVVSGIKTRIYDTITYTLQWELPMVTLWGRPDDDHATLSVEATHFNPQSTLLATIDSSLEGVIIWDIASQTIYNRFPREPHLDPHNYCRDAKFSPDGEKIAIGYEDGSIYIYNVHTKELCNVLLLKENFAIHDLNNNRPSIRELSLHFSLDGEKLFVAGDLDSIQLWDIETNTKLLDIDYIDSDRRDNGPNNMGAWYSLNGQFIATQNSTGIRTNDTNVWELSEELWKYLDGQLNIEQVKLCIELYKLSKAKNPIEFFNSFEGPIIKFWTAEDRKLFGSLPDEIKDILKKKYSFGQS